MKTTMHRKLIYTICTLFLLGGLAGCDDDTFEVYDTDASGELSQSEFEDAFNKAEWFASYDKNQNDIFESDEFILASFDYWDHNDDDVLEEAEYNYGVRNFYYPYNYGLYGTYVDWDIDDSDNLEEDEFEAAYVNTDIFKSADTDENGKLSKDEISNLVFRAMDDDNNMQIAQTEFQEDVLVSVKY